MQCESDRVYGLFSADPSLNDRSRCLRAGGKPGDEHEIVLNRWKIGLAACAPNAAVVNNYHAQGAAQVVSTLERAAIDSN
jgi:hypothetical protein